MNIAFSGAPNKAWKWEKMTQPFRKSQVLAAIRDGAMDAPDLSTKLPHNFFLADKSDTEAAKDDALTPMPGAIIIGIPVPW